MKYINEIDIFGEGINFTINGRRTVKSAIGSTFSILMLVLYILSVFIIGKDFFDKANPILTFTSVIPEEYGDPYAVEIKTVQFPFRMKNFKTSRTYNVSGLMEPYVFMTNFQKINGTLVLTQATLVESNPCTEDMLPPELIKIIEKPSDYYCPNFNKANTSLGGGQDGNFFNYVSIMWRCTKRKTGRFADEVCDYDALEKFISDTQISKAIVEHEIYYPEYYVSQSYDQPLKTNYKAFSQQISLSTQFTDKLTMQVVKFSDDKGWLTRSNKDSEAISFYSSSTSINYFDRNMVIKDKWSIYILQLVIDKKISKFDRRFMKIQDLLAQVSGILNGIHKILLIFHIIFFRYILRETLMNQIFSYKEQEVRRFIPPSTQSAVESNSDKLNVNKSRAYILSKMAIQKLNLNNNIDFVPLNNKENIRFGFFVAFKSTFCCKNKTTNANRDIYRKMNEYINKRTDFCYYLDHLKQFSILKTFILNPAQYLCLKYTKKPEIFNDEDLAMFDIELDPDDKLAIANIVKYYTEKVRDNHMNDIDSKLFYLLDTEIKNQI